MPDPASRLVVTVCLGNICRSPIAEAVLRARLAEGGVHDVEVVSAGTGDWHVGGDADPRTRAVLARNDLPLSHTAQQFDVSWFERAELVLAMDGANLAALRRLAPDPAARARVRLLRSFDPALAGVPENDPEVWVDDPYYGDDRAFERTLAEVESAVPGVVAHLRG